MKIDRKSRIKHDKKFFAGMDINWATKSKADLE